MKHDDGLVFLDLNTADLKELTLTRRTESKFKQYEPLSVSAINH